MPGRQADRQAGRQVAYIYSDYYSNKREGGFGHVGVITICIAAGRGRRRRKRKRKTTVSIIALPIPERFLEVVEN